MQLFIPPKFHPFAMLVARMVLPWRLLLADKVTRVEVDEESLERLKTLTGQRVVLCPNHSYEADSVVMFYLSSRLRHFWYFLSALENLLVPVQGLLLRNMGAYSIIRGTIDRPSFHCSRHLLAEGKRWLVIFPEGEIVGQNDVVGEFQPGVAQFSFWALDNLRAANPESELPPIYAVPMAIKYLLSRDVRPVIAQRMARLERKLGLTDYPADIYDRLAQIGQAVLMMAEHEYGIQPAPDILFSDRVLAAKGAILTRVAREVGVVLRPEQSQLDQVRALFNAVDRVMWAEPAKTVYARHLQREHQRRVVALYTDLWRVLRFAATFDGYVRETMTWERLIELINRLEWELYGIQRIIGPLTAVVRIGPHLNVTTYYDAYLRNKRGTLTSVTAELEGAVREMLTELNTRTTPLERLPQPANTRNYHRSGWAPRVR